MAWTNKFVCFNIYSFFLLRSQTMLLITIHSLLNILLIYILSIDDFSEYFHTKLNLYTPPPFFTSKQHMKTNNECKCANTIYWDFICLGTQVCAVMHPEKYSFHIQGVFNGQKIDTAKYKSVSWEKFAWYLSTFERLIKGV